MENALIMIVEDEAGIREMTEKFLVKEGYRVVSFSSGEEALENLTDTNPHLILLDIEMDGIDGFTVCQEIRKQLTVPDRKSTRLNSSHVAISYAVFCLK